MNYNRLAGVGFFVAGLVALFRPVIDPAATDIFTAVMGVGLCSLGFLWLMGYADFETGTETTRDGQRITVPIAVIVAVALFVGGVIAYMAV